MIKNLSFCLLSTLVIYSSLVSCAIDSNDKAALDALYNVTGPWADPLLPETDYCTNGRVTCDKYGKVVEFRFSYAKMKGTIPTELGLLHNLISLRIESNSFYGDIPSEIIQLPNLQVAFFHDNKLNGTIPDSIGTMKNLKFLRLENNMLTGSIPSQIGNLHALSELRLLNNKLTGTIPSEIGDLASLTLLELQQNDIIGSIPSTIGRLNLTSTVDFSGNALTGTIPTEIGSMTSLRRIILRDNQIEGAIPSQLANPPLIVSIELQNNNLVGTVPVQFYAISSQLSTLKLLGTNKLCPLQNYYSWAKVTDYDKDYSCDSCKFSPCSNNGTCINNTGGTFYCDCDGTGHSGTSCDVKLSDCVRSYWFTVDHCP